MMKEVMTAVYMHNDDNINFDFYTDLSTSDKLKLVNSVIDILIDDEHYNSIIRNLVFDFFVIDIFSDVDMSEFKNSPRFIDDVEEFLEETNIIDVIKANVKDGLMDELNKAIDDSIEYRTGIHKNVLNDALASLVNTLESKISEIDSDSMIEMANVFSGITDDFTTENIVKAYMQSDIHKNNVAEIEEYKK